MSDQGCDFVGHWQILVGHCPMTDCYLQPCRSLNSDTVIIKCRLQAIPGHDLEVNSILQINSISCTSCKSVIKGAFICSIRI